jgi:hypothetical protein
MEKINVFISHSGLDKWVAKQISSNIRRRGANAFLDTDEIEVGSNFGKIIFNFLNKANELLVLFTPWAIESPYVWFELGGAWSRPQQIRISVVLHGVSPRDFLAQPDIPSFLKSSLFIELNNIGIYFKQLCKRISEFRDFPPKTLSMSEHNGVNRRKTKYDVFLLSSPENEKWNTDFVLNLREKGITAWRNPTSIIPGDEFELDAQEVTALKESQYMIVAIDEYSRFKPRTYFDLGVAYADNKPIIIVINDLGIGSTIPDLLLTMNPWKEKSSKRAAYRVFESIKSRARRP